jgi:hypothetical protein
VLRRFHRAVKAVLFELRINGLSEARFGKAEDLGGFEPEMLFQVRGIVMLDDRVVGEIRENFSAAVFRQIICNQHKMEFAFAAKQGFATDQQNTCSQCEWEKTLYGLLRCMTLLCHQKMAERGGFEPPIRLLTV